MFREAQKNVRKAKLELAAVEQSCNNLTKLLNKKNLIFFFLGRRLPRESKSFAFVKLNCLKQDKRNNKLKCLKQTRPIDIHTLQLSVLKRDFYSMDCVDLYTEMLFYRRCDILDKCRTCSNLLRQMVPILEEKWDSVRFIDFDEALNLIKSLNHFVDESSTIVDYYRLH